MTIKLPGLVDAHVHLREPGGEYKENFETGTKAAIAGGYTQILDMPNNSPPTIDTKSIDDKIKRSRGRIWCDLGFNFGGTLSSTKYFSNVRKKVFALKVYMNHTTGTLLVEKPEEREQIFKSWSSILPIMVHAEKETVEIAIKLAKRYKRNLHVCHVTPDQIETINKARKDGLKITCEVCPHHLFLNSKDIKRLGPLGMMKPHLLSKGEQKKLWDNIDKIDTISTDHAPHTLREKFDESESKFGVPGLETVVPLFLNSVYEKRITLDKFIKMASLTPKKIFKLPEQKNTYILVDISKSFKISNKNLFTKCRWTPFTGLIGKGKVVKVIIRGKVVFEKGKFRNPPQGKIIFPRVYE